MEIVCCHCDGASPADADQSLRRCAVCHKHFCEQHTYYHSGRPFCSHGCAQYFFFSDPDD